MNRLLGLVSMLVLVAGVGAAAGGCGESACQRAAEIRDAALRDACASRPDTCCICKCWRVGAVVGSAGGECECLYANPAKDGCTGLALAIAEDCVDDEEACTEAERRGVDSACPQ